MSAETDAPFNNVEISNENREDEDLFASAVQEVSLDPELNGTQEGLEKSTIDDISVSSPATIGSSIMEEIATERSNNIIITITESQKIGEGMSSYVAYRVITKTNMPIFSRHEFAVLRRFSDFLGLHEKLTEKYLRTGRIIEEEVPVMAWPARSPDLNPIEHLWEELKKRVGARNAAPSSLGELITAIKEKWDRITQDFVKKLISSMKHRMGAVIQARGGNTSY